MASFSLEFSLTALTSLSSVLVLTPVCFGVLVWLVSESMTFRVLRWLWKFCGSVPDRLPNSSPSLVHMVPIGLGLNHYFKFVQ